MYIYILQLLDMFENLTYDTIYHEHLSYLAIRPLKKLFDQYGLDIFDVEVHEVQGRSLRVFVCRKGYQVVKKSVQNYIDLELEMGLDKIESYQKLFERILNQRKQLRTLLVDLKLQDKRIASYGAPAKGNTMLNYCHIGTEILDYALEDLPNKHNLFTPGMKIPIIPRGAIPPDYYLMLAWNYEKQILEKEQEFLKNGGHFIIPVEGIRII